MQISTVLFDNLDLLVLFAILLACFIWLEDKKD